MFEIISILRNVTKVPKIVMSLIEIFHDIMCCITVRIFIYLNHLKVIKNFDMIWMVILFFFFFLNILISFHTFSDSP